MKHPINTPVTFPRKLYDLIESESSDIVDWAEHGLAFVVKQPDVFTQEILPKYFRHTKLTSFQRQLNLYGFRRITKGPDQGAYFHPHFQRAKRELLGQIKRLPGKGAMSTPPPKSLYQAAGLHHYAATQGPSSNRGSAGTPNDFNMRMNRPANITTRAQARMTREEDNEPMYESEEAMMHRHQQQMYAQQQYVQQFQQQHQQPQYGYRPMSEPQGNFPMQFNSVPGQMMNVGGQAPYSNPQGYPVHNFVQSNRPPMMSGPVLAPMNMNHPGMFKDMTRMQSDSTQESTPSPRSTNSFSPTENVENGLAVPARQLMLNNMSTGLTLSNDIEFQAAPSMMQAPLAPSLQSPPSLSQPQQAHDHQQQSSLQQQQQPQQSQPPHLQQSGGPNVGGVPMPKSSLMRNVSTNSELWSIPSEFGDLELTDLDNLWDPNDPNAHGIPSHVQFASAAMEVADSTTTALNTSMQLSSSTIPTTSSLMDTPTTPDDSNVMADLHMPIEAKLLV